jgi:hypothetical protein
MNELVATCQFCTGNVVPKHAQVTIDPSGDTYHEDCWKISAAGKIAEGLRKRVPTKEPAVEAIKDYVRERCPGIGVGAEWAEDRDAVDVEVHYRDAYDVDRRLTTRNRVLKFEVPGLHYATDTWREDVEEALKLM